MVQAFSDYNEWDKQVQSKQLNVRGTGDGRVFATNHVPFGQDKDRLYFGMFDNNVGIGFLNEKGVQHLSYR